MTGAQGPPEKHWSSTSGEENSLRRWLWWSLRTGWPFWASVSLLIMRRQIRLAFSQGSHWVDSSRTVLCGSVFTQNFIWTGGSCHWKHIRESDWWYREFSHDNSECHNLRGQLSRLLGGRFNNANGGYLIMESRFLRVHSCDVVEFDLAPFFLPTPSVASLPTSLEAPRAFLPSSTTVSNSSPGCHSFIHSFICIYPSI